MSLSEDRSGNESEGGNAPAEDSAGTRRRLLVSSGLASLERLRSEFESRVRRTAERLPPAITGPVQLLIRAWREFVDDNCTTHAAAIAFHTLFGLFPLLLGTGVILSFFSAGREAYADALQNLSELFPEVEYLVEQNVRGSVDLRGVFGIVALGTLLWSGSRIFQALRLALNAAWDVTSRRQALKAKAVDFAAVLLIGPLMLLSVGSTALIEAVRYVVAILGDTVPFLEFLSAEAIWLAALRLIPLATSALLFEIAYVLLPNLRVRWTHALPGALLAAVLFEVGKAGLCLVRFKSGIVQPGIRLAEHCNRADGLDLHLRDHLANRSRVQLRVFPAAPGRSESGYRRGRGGLIPCPPGHPSWA